jgi:hypothetical protein
MAVPAALYFCLYLAWQFESSLGARRPAICGPSRSCKVCEWYRYKCVRAKLCVWRATFPNLGSSTLKSGPKVVLQKLEHNIIVRDLEQWSTEQKARTQIRKESHLPTLGQPSIHGLRNGSKVFPSGNSPLSIEYFSVGHIRPCGIYKGSCILPEIEARCERDMPTAL